MSLRDLVVGIDFDDIDVKKLLKIDDAMDEIEDQFDVMDESINDASKEFSKMSDKAGGAMDDVRKDTGKAGDAMDEFGDDAEKAGGQSSDAMREFADDSKRAGRQASDAMDEFADDAKRAGRQSGDAMDEFGNDAKKAGKQAEDAMDEAGDSAEDAANQAGNAGGWGAFKTAGVGAATAIVAAIGGITTAVGLMVNDMEEEFDRLEAKTGTTGKELEGLETVAKNVFSGAFGDSLGQVTDDVATLQAMFGDLNDEQLQKLTEGAYTISDLWGEEVKNVGRTVGTLTKTFDNLSEQDALDLITTGMQKTGDYSDDLLDTFNEYSSTFKNLGYDAEGFTATLISGADSGAWNMDKLADSAKEGFIKMGEGSDDTRDALGLMGLDADQVVKDISGGGEDAQKAFMAVSTAIGTIKDPVARNQAAIAAFGTPLEDLGPQFQTFFSDVEQDLGSFEGATQKAGDAAYDNFGTVMTGIFRDIKLEMADAFKDNGGEELLDKIATKAIELTPLIGDIVEEAIGFADKIAEHWPAIRETTIGITAAVGSFAAIMGGLKVIGIINTLMVAFRSGTLLATAAQWGLNTAMLANPLTWIVAGIAAVIAIGVLLYRNWDTVKEKAGQLWEWLKEKFAGIKDSVTTSLQPVMEFFDSLTGKWDNFKDSISSFKMPKIGMPKWMGGNGVIQTDGSHATGLGRVPYDGYVGELHKDESVLTANQSNALRSAGILKGDGKPVVKMNHQTKEVSNNNISRSNDRYETKQSSFNPVYNIKIDGNGNDEETVAKVKRVVREENERFWMKMQLQDA